MAEGGSLLGTDFTLVPGKGYFIYTDQPGALSVQGMTVTAAPTLTLTTGWNLIGLPTVPTTETADEVMASMAEAGLAPLEIADWSGNAWQTRVQTMPGTYVGTDFAVNRQKGYFVYVQNGGAWRTPG